MIVFYFQQLDEVAIGTNNARRYFHGIQGDKGNCGELFGIKNMFSLRIGDSCLTMDILKVLVKGDISVGWRDVVSCQNVSEFVILLLM